MTRQTKQCWAIFLIAIMAMTGCKPTQPFYFHEDGDLSHYLDMATDIEMPDEDDIQSVEASNAMEPLSLANREFDEIWEVTLEEAVCITLKNSKVMRNLGGVAQLAAFAPEQLLANPQSIPTVYDPALQEASPGVVGSGTGVIVPGFSNSISNAPGAIATEHQQGVESALSAFDARLSAGMYWERLDTPQNSSGAAAAIFPPVSEGDNSRFNIQVAKRAATGTEFFARTNGAYSMSNAAFRAQPSDWTANLEMEARHPLMRGGGTQVNRMGVVLARIRTDTTLADFELGVRNMVSDVENAYWDLYFQYRNLQAKKVGRDAALVTWKKFDARRRAGEGGVAEEAQAKQQYYRFRADVEAALRDLYKVENRLRYVMGLSPTDGRLIRPSDEPTTAEVTFDWRAILAETLYRTPELRKQKWQIKRREMELITARNDLLPTLDVVALYRWLGKGDDLIAAPRRGLNFAADGSQAWDELTEGRFQEWALGFQFEMPIGFRKELAGVRYFQLALAREQARLEDMELEAAHSLTDAVQDQEAWYALAQTNFNWWVAARREVEVIESFVRVGKATADVLLDAQQRRADAETAYYQAVVGYNKAITQVHYRKGSLLEYNSIMLAEGPWPHKAYFDAMAHARRRDASHFVDYGYTRPRVISRGPAPQGTSGAVNLGDSFELAPAPAPTPADGNDVIEPILEPEDAAMQSRPTTVASAFSTTPKRTSVVAKPASLQPVAQASFDWSATTKAAGESSGIKIRLIDEPSSVQLTSESHKSPTPAQAAAPAPGE